MVYNQTIQLRNIANNKALVWVGDAEDTELEAKINIVLTDLNKTAKHRAALSRRDRELIDGRVARRVACAILELLGNNGCEQN